MISTSTWVLILAALIGAIALFNDSKWKVYIRTLSFIVIIIALFVQIYDEHLKTQHEVELDRASRKNWDASMKNATDILKKVNVAVDTLRNLQDSLHKQLTLQKKINQTATYLTSQNQSLNRQGEEIYKNTDRLFNPIFPITVRLRFDIMCDDPQVLKLRDVFFRGRDTWEKANAPDPLATNIFGISQPQKVLKGDLLKEYKNLLSCELMFIKIPSNKIQDINRNDPQFNFILKGNAFKTYQDIEIDFYKNVFHIEAYFSELEFTNSYDNPSNTIWL